jgi:hypothetical protein
MKDPGADHLAYAGCTEEHARYSTIGHTKLGERAATASCGSDHGRNPPGRDTGHASRIGADVVTGL